MGALSWHEMASFVLRRTGAGGGVVPTLFGNGAALRGIRAFSSLPSPVVLSRQPTHTTAPTKSQTSLSNADQQKHFSTTTATMSSKAFLETVKARRTDPGDYQGGRPPRSFFFQQPEHESGSAGKGR